MARRSSSVFVFGLVIFCLGFGNWSMGLRKMAQHKERQLEAIRDGGVGVTQPFRGTASILEERSDAHEYYEDAVTRYRYYKLVRRGGRFLMVIGALLVLGALVRRIVVPSGPRAQPRYRTLPP